MINVIRQQFDQIEAYQPTERDIPQLQKLSTINKHDLRDTIMKMPSKSSELDSLTISLMERVLDSCLPATVRVVKLSLDKGEFCTNWKTAVVKPLIKSTQKVAAKSHYRPVSNLLFISKVVEKCVRYQLT